MEMCKSEALVILGKAINLETSPIFTQVPQYSMERSKWFRRLYRAYRDPHSYGQSVSMPSAVREATEDEEALLVMAKVRAYFEIAYKVCCAFLYTLFPLLTLSGI